VRLEVDENHVQTVRRIFERYAAGDSLKRIAINLNNDGIASPQPQKGRVSQSWCPSSIRHILHNERYRGVVIWGKTFKLQSQETGKRIYCRKPATEWRRRPIPEQRIVSDELWNQVQSRLKMIHRLYGKQGGGRPTGGRAAGSPYLFTGLLKCSLCNGSITIVSGQWKKRNDSRYGCSMHAYRGEKVCTNNLLVDRRVLERQLLAGLQERVLSQDVIDYTLGAFEEQLLAATNRSRVGDALMQRRVDSIEKQIRNCTDAIADGKRYPSLMDKLADLEKELSDTRAKIEYSEPRSVRLRMNDTRRFVESRVGQLQSLLNADPRIARAEIAKHVEKITLTPEGRVYIASGDWNLLASAAVTMVPGARIELATPAFSGRRSTNELPRLAIDLV
jgi:site-specific DNA recombinase